MPRVVLLGDSILDNAPYTQPHPDTTEHLARALGSTWKVERLALDGAVMADVQDQLGELDGRPDVVVLSIGGNDLTAHVGLLDQPASRSSEVLHELMTIADSFTESYEDVVRAVAERADHTILCTIYEVRLEPDIYARLARVPLAVLNDRIIQVGARFGLHVLDLRGVCTEPDDFVLQIEPSPKGAEKIARALTALLIGPRGPHARVFAG